MSKCIIITVDGVAASGKGTLSARLAEHFGFEHLDSGSLYRRSALAALEQGVDLNDTEKLTVMIGQIDFSKPMIGDLRAEVVSQAASKIAMQNEVRRALDKAQRTFPIGKKGIVTDGRDMGTVIFPDADLKFFITASLEERAKRRYLQLNNKKNDVIFEAVLNELRERDIRDSERAVSPTVPAKDAVIIDTTELDADAVFRLAISLSQKTVSSFLDAA
jgi:cytidylate kinase